MTGLDEGSVASFLARPAALVAGLGLTTATLAGCTSSSAPDAHVSPRATGSVPALSGAKLPAGVTGASDVPANVPNKPTKRANVVMSSCAAHPEGWAASGAVHNPAASPASYQITVFFTTDHATVIGAASTTVSVGAQAKKTWSVSAKFHPATPTLCVLRGVG